MINDFAKFESYRNKKVLEIGVGAGVDHLEFAKNGAHLVGVDVTAISMLATSRRFSNAAILPHLVRCDAEHLPFVEEVFDMVYSWGVIHHLANPGSCVSEIYRVLKKRGELRVMAYHRRSLYSLWLWLIYGLPHGAFGFGQTLGHFLESPGTKAFTISEIFALFRAFRIRVVPEITGADLIPLHNHERLWQLARRLFSRLGFFLLIEGEKA